MGIIYIGGKGPRQPRSLSVAFLEPVKGAACLNRLLKSLREQERTSTGSITVGLKKDSGEKDEKGETGKDQTCQDTAQL